MKDQKELEIKIRKSYLELGSIRKVSKALDIKLWKVQKIVKDCGLFKKLDTSDEGYLKDRNVTIEQLKSKYEELSSFRKVAEELNLGKNRTKEILKNLGVLKKVGHSLKYDKTGDKNPFFGKTHTDEVKSKLSQNAKDRTAKRNPNYKHGKNVRRPRDYKTAELTKLRNFTFNRDNFTCQYCEQKGGHLHAHHKIPFWVEPKAFLDSDNLTTVCTDCHFTKAHEGNWHKFDLTIVENSLLEKYSLDRERLSGLTVIIEKGNNGSDSLDSEDK